MNDLLPLVPGDIILLQSPPLPSMLTLIATLATNGPLAVLDANNQFDAYRVARLIRRQTADLDAALQRISVARAFTCYQVVALFDQLEATAVPQVVLDLLATFDDESVPIHESRRLLQLVLYRIHDLSRTAPVVVTARPSRVGRLGLMASLADLAGRRLVWEATPASAAPRLF